VAINFSQVTGVAIILPWSNLQSHHRCIWDTPNRFTLLEQSINQRFIQSKKVAPS